MEIKTLCNGLFNPKWHRTNLFVQPGNISPWPSFDTFNPSVANEFLSKSVHRQILNAITVYDGWLGLRQTVH